MKKFLLLLFLAPPLFGEPFFCNLNLKANGTFAFSSDSKNTGEFVFGSYVNSNFVSLRAFTNVPKTQFSELKTLISENNFSSLFTKKRYSADIAFFKKSVNFKAGSISYSRSVSRLKNPAPVVPYNPVVKSFNSTAGIGVALPTATSTKKTDSFYFCFDLFRLKIPFMAQGSFNPEEKSCLFSLNSKFNFTRRIFLQSFATFSSDILENNSTYLKQQNSTFTGGRFCAFSLENIFCSPFFKLNFYSGLHQNPLEKSVFWINARSRCTAGQFLLDASFYAIPSAINSIKAVPLVSTDSSIIKTTYQFSLNPQVIFLTKNENSITLGITAAKNQKIVGTTNIALIETAKIAGGILFEKPDFSLKSTITAGNILLAGTPPTKSTTPDKFYDFYFTSTRKKGILCGTFSGRYREFPPKDSSCDKKQVISAGTSKNFGQKKQLKLAGNFNSTLKAGKKDSANVLLSSSWTIKQKYFSSTIKVEFNHKL